MKWYQRSACKISFQFIKTIEYPKLDHEPERKKYDLLKSMDFGRIHIPNFTYVIKDNTIIFNVDYIKGCQLCLHDYCHPRHWSKIIYEDLIDNDSPYGFSDLSPDQFVCEVKSEKMYLVDFESFEPMTLEEKKEVWRNSLLI